MVVEGEEEQGRRRQVWVLVLQFLAGWSPVFLVFPVVLSVVVLHISTPDRQANRGKQGGEEGRREEGGREEQGEEQEEKGIARERTKIIVSVFVGFAGGRERRGGGRTKEFIKERKRTITTPTKKRKAYQAIKCLFSLFILFLY